MRLLRPRALVRSCVAAATGVALVVPLASVADAADGGARSAPAVRPLALAPDEYLTLGDAFQPVGLTTSPTGREDPGLLLTTPAGGDQGVAAATLHDNDGQLLWQRDGYFLNLEQVTYQGEPALALFDDARGVHVLLDESYTEVATFALRGGPTTDAHDLTFSPDGSRVLVAGWEEVPVDLSPWGGSADGTVLETIIQEQDVATGEVTFEWRALDHVSPGETQEPMLGPDLFHLNSLTYDTDGAILASLRNTSTVYRIDPDSGEILWRFGGENSDVTFVGGAADTPSYQHDARRLPDGSLSVFDNGNNGVAQESRGAIYTLDETTMTATLRQDLRADPPAFATILGSNRQVSNGDQLVSYGNTGRMVEFADGEEVFSAQFDDAAATYRAVRTTDWTGVPAAAPEVVLGAVAEDGSRPMHMSWNGATEVESWRIDAGPDEDRLTTVGSTPVTGLETAAEVTAPEDADVFRVTALDADGRPLDSATRHVPDGS